MHRHNRSSVVHQLRYALGHPGRIPRHLRRLTRNTWLRLRNRDHVSYYRAVMRSDTARDPYAAVGSASHRRWAALGKMQFDYLVRHGLRPEHRVLEIGCGNLRAGRLLIGYLDTGNYHGIDISPDILIAAQETLARYRLRERFPHLMPVRDLRFAALPDGAFDVVHAHSVFSHSPIQVIEECFRNVGRIMKPGGWFDFTFDRTEGEEHQVLGEDFYYRTETLIDLAARCGLRATFMEDWERLPHRQSKIRVTLPGSAEEARDTGDVRTSGDAGNGGNAGNGGDAGNAGGRVLEDGTPRDGAGHDGNRPEEGVPDRLRARA